MDTEFGCLSLGLRPKKGFGEEFHKAAKTMS